MKLRIMVLEQNQVLRELLQTYFSELGHDVLAFSDPTVCPFYGKRLDEPCFCHEISPCADVVLADFNVPNINALDFLTLQQRRGCKVLDANKAVMSASMTKALTTAIEELGCHYIEKPFRLAEIGKWLEDCAARVMTLKLRES